MEISSKNQIQLFYFHQVVAVIGQTHVVSSTMIPRKRFTLWLK